MTGAVDCAAAAAAAGVVGVAGLGMVCGVPGPPESANIVRDCVDCDCEGD